MADGDEYSRSRALVTDDEWLVLSGATDADEDRYSIVVSRVRARIHHLVQHDLPALDEHDTLGTELRENVCDDWDGLDGHPERERVEQFLERGYSKPSARALLTASEFDALDGGIDPTNDKYDSIIVSRVRNKIDRLVRHDLQALDEHETLGAELREMVCSHVDG